MNHLYIKKNLKGYYEFSYRIKNGTGLDITSSEEWEDFPKLISSLSGEQARDLFYSSLPKIHISQEVPENETKAIRNLVSTMVHLQKEHNAAKNKLEEIASILKN